MKNKLIIILFISVSLILYILFIFCSSMVPVIELEYTGILLCLITSFLLNGKAKVFIRLGLLVTAISDFLLLFTNCNYIISVLIFSIVHLIYGYKLYAENKKYVFVVMRFILIIIALAIIIKIYGFDLLLIVVIFYFINLVINVIYSFINRQNIIFAIGLLLFLCCDIFVGLKNGTKYLNIEVNFPIDLIWFFYFPSQVLITLSILYKKNLSKKDFLST